MEIESFLKKLIDISDKLYLVGGSVRDYLLKIPCYDYDFAIKNKTIEIGKLLSEQTKGSFFILDYERETVRVVWNIEGKLFNFDIAKIIGENLENDLILRDLTLNAIAIDINQDNYENIVKLKDIDNKYFIDPSNGKVDIENKLIKTSNVQNLIDDPLRMLRVFRFYTKFSFDIDTQTLLFIQENSEKISTIAKERVLKELYDILAFNNSSECFEKMEQFKLIYSIFSADFFDKNKFSRSIKFIENFELNYLNDFTIHAYTIDKYLNRILLLNKKIKELLKLTLLFTGIKDDSISDIDYLKYLEIYCKLFKFSSVEQKFILKSVKFALDIKSFNNLEFNRKALYLFFKEHKEEVISSSLIIFFSNYKNQQINNKIFEILDIYFTDTILSKQPEIINGEEIIQVFNLKQGRVIGEMIESVRQAQAENIITDKNQAIEFIKTYRLF